MTTGSGLIHSELVTEEFKKKGGVMQGLQIWINLPQKNKKAKPRYQHIPKDQIPIIKLENDEILIKVLVGTFMDAESTVQTYSPVSILDVKFSMPGGITIDVSKEQIAMAYVIDGELQFAKNNKTASKGHMIYFDQESDSIDLASISSSGSYLILLGKTLKEPIARHGSFVANTDGEIRQAMLDYQNGKMGRLE